MKLKFTFFLLIVTLFVSCDDGCFLGIIGPCDDTDDITSDNPNSDAIIYADFSNDGTNQNLELDESLTSGPIQIENEVTFTIDGSRFNFEFSGVTFIQGENVFEIDNIISQRFDENEWQQDSENFLDFEPSKSLDIVLVLDVSSSLGQNLQDIKISAISVLSQIFNNNMNAKVAIVKFSRGHIVEQLSSNQFELQQFISQNTEYNDQELGGGLYILENQNETALYEAMLEGIHILQNSNARGQGLITFTDGANNFQFDPQNSDRSIVIDALNASEIRSYTVGFVGNADEVNDQALTELAINGNFSKPSSIDELNEVFTVFSNSVGAVYDLIYDTNNAPFNGPKTYRFLVDLNQIN
ncbi:VWA domain-containing protein [Dokdonia ponticola]|uniref:VWA domain-containing protein n=1 Tax=Dokdonia ponticola TaxID=2041041 RepID=A0ABV9HSM1_9FLAO